MSWEKPYYSNKAAVKGLFSGQMSRFLVSYHLKMCVYCNLTRLNAPTKPPYLNRNNFTKLEPYVPTASRTASRSSSVSLG